MQRNGVVLVICAPSGAGKTTLTKKLLEEFPDFGYSISCTTRLPRPGEIDGKDYHFLNDEQFNERKANGYFAEWAKVHSNFYGTPLQPALRMLQEGKDLLFEIDVQGAAQIRLTLPQSTCIFIMPPSMEILKQRLYDRNLDKISILEERMLSAVQEIKEAHWFDKWLINDNLEKAYDQLRSIYISSTLNPKLRPLLVRNTLGKYNK